MPFYNRRVLQGGHAATQQQTIGKRNGANGSCRHLIGGCTAGGEKLLELDIRRQQHVVHLTEQTKDMAASKCADIKASRTVTTKPSKDMSVMMMILCYTEVPPLQQTRHCLPLRDFKSILDHPHDDSGTQIPRPT
jgi:hypothetical protein